MSRPLDGIRVFDLTLAGVGPWSTKLLGELGADVIHVDAPTRDPNRGIPPFYNGLSILYITANYNKRAISLDLKNTKDRESAYALLRTCDIFVENMRPGAVDRLGLSYEAVSEINPRIIYLSASGYGQTGPMVKEAGADPQIQSFSGWASITGEPGGKAQLFRHFAHLDFNTSMYNTQAILMALFARERTGKGQKIEIAMLGAAMALQTSRMAEYFATGATPPRQGSACVTTVPHQAFLCQDRQYLAVGVVKEEQWPRLCRALGLEQLAVDPRFTSNRLRVENRHELVPLLEKVFATKPVRWWEIQFTKEAVPHGRFLSFDPLRYHPQVVANGFIREIETPHWGSLFVEGPPWRFSDSDDLEVRAGPLPGEHTDEVLQELTQTGREPAEAMGLSAGD